VKYIKLAAIDIGSNSIRLLISNVIPTPGHTYYRKVSITRLPVRLGEDVFTTGKISKENAARLTDAMRAYKFVMKVNGVTDFRACATSAMREAKNGASLVRRIAWKTGINIDVINGEEEARLIFLSKMFDTIQPEEKNFVYIDVGGGSTEYTLFLDGEIKASRSFKIGTVRILNNLDTKEEWQEMQEWVKSHTEHIEDLGMIGSGGNINKTHKLSGKLPNEPLSLRYLSQQLKMMSGMSTEDRVTQLGLNFDRADVIVHALKIYISAMHWAGTTRIYVPKIGVSDGIIRDLYHNKYKSEMESVPSAPALFR
jgi:exopolyphosphatase/guanosine-5'-triphosphate,3'-diphosphate pyrophosphatase